MLEEVKSVNSIVKINKMRPITDHPTARLSHIPLAILAKVFAEQGAMRTTSAHLRSSICRIGSPILKFGCANVKATHKDEDRNTDIPLVLVNPNGRPDGFHIEKCQRRLCRYDLNLDIAIL
jgi:hypothetical protein